MLEKLSKTVGLTQSEIKVTLFIVITFVLCFGYKSFFVDNRTKSYKIVNKSELSDLRNDSNKNDLILDSVKSINKKVDYKQEVLDFNKQSFNNVQKKTVLEEKSININSAVVSDLIKLSGIGEKTAQKIIDYRNSIGKFKNIEQLLNVNGIGDKKLNKIKKYIYID